MSYNTYLSNEIARGVNKKFCVKFSLQSPISFAGCQTMYVRSDSKLIEWLCRDCFYRLYLYPEEKWEVGCRRGAMSWSAASDTTYSFAPPTVSQALRGRKNQEKKHDIRQKLGPPPPGGLS